MNDFIRRQDAIDTANRADYTGLTVEDVEKVTDEVVKGLKRLPSAQPEWIPVTERLPKEYAQYLVCFEDGKCYVYLLDDSDWARGLIEKENIVAWMPLPEPWKGEDMKDLYIEAERKEIELIDSVLTYARLGLKNAQMHNCNDCTKKDCEYRPDWGDDVRINCPLWEGGDE